MSQKHQRAAAAAFAALRLLMGKAPLPVVIGIVVLVGVGAWLLPTAQDQPPVVDRAPPRLEAPAEAPDAPRAKAGGVDADQAEGRQSVDQLARECGLESVGRSVYVSPAGVRYRRGSEQGHRLLHLATHTQDNPSRPFSHGVFAGENLPDAVAIVDDAYRQAQAGKRVDVEREGRRTVYRVEMGRRVGYVGGQRGAARGRPAARRIQLVMEGGNLITAYPVK
ncbi:MAG: hypothetical protein AAGJ46_10670 [Planctomycetota bacterium]